MTLDDIKEKILLLWKLMRIEKAIGIRLTMRQRKAALSDDPLLHTWGRRTGRTTTACIWTLLHRKEPVDISAEINNEMNYKSRAPHAVYNRRPFAIPDPEIYDQRSFSVLNHALCQFEMMVIKCEMHGIKVCGINRRTKR